MKATVVLPMRDDQVLMGKKTKKVGVGMWNGFGGKQEAEDMSMEHTAVRELYEETGSGIVGEMGDLELCAVVDFDNGGHGVNFEVYFYILKKFTGEYRDTDEMIDISWHDKNNIDYDNMLPADRQLFEKIFAGEKFSAKVTFSQDMKKVESIKFADLILENKNN